MNPKGRTDDDLDGRFREVLRAIVAKYVETPGRLVFSTLNLRVPI